MNLLKKRPYLLIPLVLLFLSVLLLFPLTLFKDRSNDFDSYLHDLFALSVTGTTIDYHYSISHGESFGLQEPEPTLGSISLEGHLSYLGTIENVLNRLSSYKDTQLSLDQRLSRDAIKEYYISCLNLGEYYYYDDYLSPISGIQSQLPILLAEYSFDEEEDIATYLSLLTCIPNYLDEVYAFEIEKSNAGLFMSAFAYEDFCEQIDGLTSTTDNHFLIETFDERLENCAFLSSDQKAKYEENNRSLVTTVVLPAFSTLKVNLSSLAGTGTNEQGLYYYPYGKAYYEALITRSTSSSHSPEELFQRIEAQRSQDLQEAFTLVQTTPSLLNSTDSSPLNLLSAEEILQILEEKCSADFPLFDNYQYTVKKVPGSIAAYTSPAFYLTAPLDDSNRNLIYINEMDLTPGLSLFTTLAHEGFPGHLYQTVTSYEMEFPPMRYLLNFGGYTEGWATYVEMLSYSYSPLDPALSSYFQKNAAAILSLYASADIGIHYYGWTLSDTCSFYSEYGITNTDTITNVYHAIVEEPGNYLKYYTGYLEFLALQKQAKALAGDAFTLYDFHQALMRMGSAPFSVLEEYLPQYYSSKSAL